MWVYADSNPINLIDPLGLINPTKVITSAINALNAGRLYAIGILKLAGAAGLIETGVGAPVGAGMSLLGAWNIYSATRVQQRALLQWREALEEEWSDATLRNFLGILPFGQHFDDPCEPTPKEFLGMQYQKAASGTSGLLEIIGEIGTLGP